MSKERSKIPLLHRSRKRVEESFQKIGLESFIRGVPLLLTTFLTILTILSIIGSVLQIIVIWEYPPEMWTKTIVLENVKDGMWKSVFMLTYFNPKDIGFLSFLYVFLLGLSTWLFSTKVNQLKKLVFRYIVFYTAILTVFFKWASWASIPVKVMFTPWIAGIMVQYVGKTPAMNLFLEDNVVWFTWGVLFLPLYAVYYFLAWFTGLLMQHAERWHEWFGEYEFKHHLIQGVSEMQRSGAFADICIGIYVDTAGKIKAIMRGLDRATHTIIVGSIGTGKSAAALLPIIRLDMKHLVKYINNFQTDDYQTLSQRLSGLTIIDPSNDLCSKSYRLAKAHGIPDEAIFYLDPENKDSKSYNPLRGPAETVAATFVFVLEGLQPDQEDFYKNTQAVHLYYHILLVKLLHDAREEVERIIRTDAPTYPDPIDPTIGKPILSYKAIFGNNACTLDTLMKLYRDPWLAKQAARSLKVLLPEDWENQFQGDDLSYYSIIEQTSAFVNDKVTFKTNYRGEVTLYPPDSPHFGEVEIVDTYADKITGLTNVLNQMSSNTYFRRVMFGDSGLDLDVTLRTGGILLINTADGIMGKLSGYFAQIMLQSMVQAVYRRDISKGQPPGHHIVVDEFPKYAYESYPDFPANARKYGGFVTIGMQTMAQMESRFSKAYLETIIGVHRNRMVYQGVPLLDAEYFSKYFGTKKVYQTAEGRTFSAATQDSPGMTESEKYQLVEVPRFAPHEISQSKKYEAVLQLNIDNEQQIARRVKADFVPKSEFKNAKEKPEPHALQAWIERIHYEASQGPVTKGNYVCGLIDREAEDFLNGKDITYTSEDLEDDHPGLDNTEQVSSRNPVTQKTGTSDRNEEDNNKQIPVVPIRNPSSNNVKPFDFSLPMVSQNTVPPAVTDLVEEREREYPVTSSENERALEETLVLSGEEESYSNLHEVDSKRIQVQSLRQQRDQSQRVPMEQVKRQVNTSLKPGRVMGQHVTNNVVHHEAQRSLTLDKQVPKPIQEDKQYSKPVLREPAPSPATLTNKQEETPSNPFANVDISKLMPSPAPQGTKVARNKNETHQNNRDFTAKVIEAENFREAPEPADTQELLKAFVSVAQEHKPQKDNNGGEDE
ncbi:type IV secretion system DNA-binding domain-containing protein [Brevibacillus sp. AG]|uniref:type IV secretory system conjugative DNA transfer family protein n=1 Tax=Brevibacillus sp. AG TaxID=3020891 RepID=UPI00232F97E1|nr:type IV secretory system conjugative DNA transfer family protein [Brevibacillus sp. AG]MDC0764180.1 type IV secretion system DNA-binding domain-containing protein [Brevibacillus sp. AG]